MKVYVAGVTPAMQYAKKSFLDRSIGVADSPDWEITDVLLDVPSFRPGGMKPEALSTMLTSLPRDVTVWGGNINLDGFSCRDLLQDEGYLWENAAITARCALQLTSVRETTRTLILGWGRIGTHLGIALREKGCPLTIAVRNETDLNRLRALGYDSVLFRDLSGQLDFDFVVNTVPCPVMDSERLPEDCFKLDLASQQGITGSDVVWARGLPGIYAPEESGKLIAETVLQHRKETEK